jgi:spore coat protein U-like protein
MRWTVIFQVLLFAGALLVWSAPARAGCTISVSGVTFGNYDVDHPMPLDATGSVVLVCQRHDRRVRVTLSTGSSGTYTARTLRQGSSVLRYNLFIGGFASVWGDGTQGTDYYFNNNPRNDQPIPITIYGRIPAQQDVAAGAYTDAVVVQIDF